MFRIRDGEEDIAPPESQIEAQCHPFHRECRAFARLKEVRKENLAVKCYGYLEFDAATEQALADQLGLDDWDRDPEFYPQWESQPLRAIVKEFLAPDLEFSRQDATKMVCDLREIHRCGIIVNDIKYDAYVGRQLVDFSFAVTVPHVQFDKRFRYNHSEPATPYDDFGGLEEAFRFWNYLHPSGRQIKVRPGYEMEYRLRSCKVPYEPQDFDWKACADQWTKLPRRSARRRTKQWGSRRKNKKRIKRSLAVSNPNAEYTGHIRYESEDRSEAYYPELSAEQALRAEAEAQDDPENWKDLEFIDDPPEVLSESTTLINKDEN